jgi:Xaa-Pro aminopeptidase
MEDRNLSPSIALMGHGLGLNVHESPFLIPTDETVIKPGMVISIESFTEVPGLSPIAVEDAGVVTEDGWEGFTSLPREIKEI